MLQFVRLGRALLALASVTGCAEGGDAPHGTQTRADVGSGSPTTLALTVAPNSTVAPSGMVATFTVPSTQVCCHTQRNRYVLAEPNDPSCIQITTYDAQKCVARDKQENPALYGTLAEYAASCACAVGTPMPEFTCANGALIDPGPSKNNLETDTDCPRQSIAEPGSGCNKGTRLIVETNGDSTWVALCRRNKDATPVGKYDQVGVIGHNAKTGASCFFQAKEGTPLTGVTPLPTTPAGKAYWQWSDVPGGGRLNINCAICHDVDPWIHTPWIDAPTDVKVPKGINTAHYWLVGGLFPPPTVLKEARDANDQPVACFTCHSRGVSATEMLTPYSIGGQQVTYPASRFPRYYWMPSTAATQPGWLEDNKHDADVIKACVLGGHSTSSKCTFRTGETPPPGAGSCVEALPPPYAEPSAEPSAGLTPTSTILP